MCEDMKRNRLEDKEKNRLEGKVVVVVEWVVSNQGMDCKKCYRDLVVEDSEMKVD